MPPSGPVLAPPEAAPLPPAPVWLPLPELVAAPVEATPDDAMPEAAFAPDDVDVPDDAIPELGAVPELVPEGATPEVPEVAVRPAVEALPEPCPGVPLDGP